MTARLTVAGCGWHAHVVAELAEMTGKYTQVKLLDRDWPVKSVWGDWPVTGGFEVLKENLSGLEDEYFVALGDNGNRVALCQQIVENGGKLATLVHPAAFVSPRAHLEPGTVICAGALIQTYARIGIGCIVNTAASIDHHCVLADGVHLSPGVRLSGNVSVGERTWLGTGVCVRDKLTIGSDIVVGMGSTIVKDLVDAGVYYGSPIKK
jgi:sugar O-acyltransferase (sialic acid O-acetyltransferase NeuD family)